MKQDMKSTATKPFAIPNPFLCENEYVQQTLKLSQPNTSGLGMVWYIQIGSFHTSQDICKTLATASSDAINDYRIVNLTNPTNDSSDSMKQIHYSN